MGSLLASTRWFHPATNHRGRVRAKLPPEAASASAAVPDRSGWGRDSHAAGPDEVFKSLKVVADGHGQSQQFFEGLARRGETDGDLPGFEADAVGEAGELLGEDADGRLDQQLGTLETLPAEVRDIVGDFAAACEFVLRVFARGQTAQVREQGCAAGEGVRADMVRHGGSHDLLRAAAADAQQNSERGTVDKGAGQGLEFGFDVVDSADPASLRGHGSIKSCLCAPAQNGKNGTSRAGVFTRF